MHYGTRWRIRLRRWTLLCLVVLFTAGCGQADQTGQVETTAVVITTAQPAATVMIEATAEATVTIEATAEATVVSTALAAATEVGTTVAATEVGTAVAATEVATVVPGETFQNPVLRTNFPDPGVIMVDGAYYAYATNGSGKNVQLARSPDLVNWELLSDAMPALAPWVKLSPADVWAPEVIKIGEQYLLYYTVRDELSGRQCVGVATSDKPEGKFRDTSERPLVCQIDEGGTIDASPFRDGDKLYLYFKNDGNCCGFATYLYVQELAPDGLSLVGEPERLVRNDKSWEGRVVEAPTMWKHDDDYYLFFSANDYSGLRYAIGYALCEGPAGPCEDAPDNPILETSLEKPPVIGPGHQTIVVDDDGETWLVYHAWEVTSSGLKTDRRLMWIDELVWEGGNPDVLGPTIAPQPVP